MKIMIITSLVLAVLLVGVQTVMSIQDNAAQSAAEMPGNTKAAVFAGGCFWCTESDFEKVDGVVEAISGYTGGKMENPTYKQVARGGTGHVEAVKVIYDPAKITYQQLLKYFWRHVDPTDADGSFVDRGRHYRSVIFYADAQEKRVAEASKQKLAASGVFDMPIVTDILPLGAFYEAENYHQDYYRKNKLRYKWYRSGSGRDQFLKKTWADRPMPKLLQDKMAATPELKKMSQTMNKSEPMPSPAGMSKKTGTVYTIPDDTELRRQLTPLQYRVVRRNGTERPFDNTYWDNKKEGIYVDIVSGEPLFSSTDKFKSGTGWPSFTRALVSENVIEKQDRSLFMVRTEVRSKHANSHLGHLFEDGPKPTGLRYCINSAALRFVPKEDLEREGYVQYTSLFKN